MNGINSDFIYLKRRVRTKGQPDKKPSDIRPTGHKANQAKSGQKANQAKNGQKAIGHKANRS
jgi:hypothetical protein